jgi:CheY-like chemotaxis protein
MDVKRILIVGDHVAIQALLEDDAELYNNDNQVVFTTESSTGLARLRDLSFDLILVADETPDMSGLKPSQAAREIWPDARIVGMDG